MRDYSSDVCEARHLRGFCGRFAMHDTPDEYRRFHRRRHRTLLDLLARYVPRKVGRCLDIGGSGDIADAGALLADRFAEELHAVDQAPHVEMGRGKGVSARQCDVDLEPLPYEDSFFDIVILASVIEHLYNPHRVLDEIARTLKPGGILLVETPNAVASGRRIDALLGKNPFRWFNEHNAFGKKSPLVNCSIFYTAEEIEALLADRFTILERRYCMHTPPVNPVKALLREAVFRLCPRLGDCFFVVARRTRA